MKFIRSNFLLVFIIAIGFLLVLGCHEAEGQIRRKNTAKNKRIANYKGGAVNFKNEYKYWSVGFNINSTNYFGDITPTDKLTSLDINSTRLGLGTSVNYRLTPYLSLGSSLTWNRLYGDDYQSADPKDESSGVYRYNRNLHFRNDIMELAAFGVVDLLDNRGSYFVRAVLVPYVFGGVAVFYHNPKAIAPTTDIHGAPLAEGGKWVPLRPLGTEGQHHPDYDVKAYSPFQLALPFGLGVRYRLNNYFDLELEFGYRFLFTDYIDDVSGNYVDPGALDSELARAMSFRSLEPVAAVSGKERQVSQDHYQYQSRYDGRNYHVLRGYGHDGTVNSRGNADDNDHYVVTSLKIKYILHAKVRKVKFR